jgi:protein TonB
LNLRKFFVYSLAVHALIIAVTLFIVPAPGKKKAGGELFADLVSPAELFSGKPLPPTPSTRAKLPSRPKSAASAPANSYKRKTRPEKGSSYDQINRPSGTTKDTRAAPPSANVSKGGQGGSPGESPTGAEGSRNILKPDGVGSTLKEKLFDKKVIGDLAQRNVAKEEKNRTFSFDAKEYRFLLYNRRLKERIESIWHYPPDAAARGIYGDLDIRFTIKKNGQLGAVELVRTSGHKNLDDAAIEALTEGAPYWPLPEEWDMEAYTIEGHFVYSLYGYYIR